jgi:hypothetical protein
MVTIPGDEVASIGIEFLAIDGESRIVSDHQFIIG